MRAPSVASASIWLSGGTSSRAGAPAPTRRSGGASSAAESATIQRVLVPARTRTRRRTASTARAARNTSTSHVSGAAAEGSGGKSAAPIVTLPAQADHSPSTWAEISNRNASGASVSGANDGSRCAAGRRVVHVGNISTVSAPSRAAIGAGSTPRRQPGGTAPSSTRGSMPAAARKRSVVTARPNWARKFPPTAPADRPSARRLDRDPRAYRLHPDRDIFTRIRAGRDLNDLRKMCLGRLHPPRREGVHRRLPDPPRPAARRTLHRLPGTAAQSTRARSQAVLALLGRARGVTETDQSSSELPAHRFAAMALRGRGLTEFRASTRGIRVAARHRHDRPHAVGRNARGAGRPYLHRAARHGHRARHRDPRLVFGTAASRGRARPDRGPELGGTCGGRGRSMPPAVLPLFRARHPRRALRRAPELYTPEVWAPHAAASRLRATRSASPVANSPSTPPGLEFPSTASETMSPSP